MSSESLVRRTLAVGTIFLGLSLLPDAGHSGENDSQPSPSALTDAATPPQTAAASSTPVEHPLMPALRLAKTSLDAFDRVADYEATFVKRERIGKRLITHRINMRLRGQPFSVYLKFIEPHQGREIIYVEGRNQNKLLAREGSGLRSLIGTISLSPTGSEAMAENRYPITMIGMQRMLETIIVQWENETKYGEIEVKYYPNATLAGRACQVIQASHPQPRRQFKFHLTRLYIDKESELPVRVEQYGFPTNAGDQPPLIEEYTYSDIRANVGLSDHDFDRSNRNYGF